MNRQAQERDRAVRRSGRVRTALVGGATAASVGIAGILGVSALSAPASGSAAPQSSTGNPTRQPATTQPRQGSSLVADLKTFASGQQVSNGTGHVHATTKGS